MPDQTEQLRAEVARLRDALQEMDARTLAMASDAGIYDGESAESAADLIRAELDAYSRLMWRLQALCRADSARREDVFEGVRRALATPAPPDPKDGQIAMLREALEKSECWCPRLFICPHCGGDVVEGQDQYAGSWICGKCVRCVTLPRDEKRKCTRCAALSQSPGEWLEEQRRQAKIEALEVLPCEDIGTRPQGNLQQCFETKYPEALWCPRCRALAALKGGK